MQHINLINPRLVPRRQWLPPSLMLGLAVAGGALLIGRFWYESSAMKQLMAAATVAVSAAASSVGTGAAGAPGAGAQAAAHGGPAVADAGASAPARAAQLQSRIATLEALRAVSQSQTRLPKGIAPTLNAIIASLNDKLWLSEIDIGANGAVRIIGGTLDPQAMAALTEQLSKVPALKGTAIGVLRIEPWSQDPAGESGTPDAPAMPPAHRFVLASAGNSGEETP